METIDLKELFDYFKNKIKFIVIVLLVMLVIGFIYGKFIKTPMYASSASIVLVNEDSNEKTLTNNDVILNESLVSTYSQIVKSRKVLNAVIKNLNLDCDYETLSKTIEVSSLEDTQIINIKVVNDDKALAMEIANETALVFEDEVPNLYEISNITILDHAIKAKNPYNVNVIKDMAIFMMVGLVLSCGVIFLFFYFDRTIKNTDQIEEIIKLPVLGKVHNWEGK